MFFKETNSDRHIKLMLGYLFGELTEDKYNENSRYLQKLVEGWGWVIEDKVLLFQDNSSVVCREIFLQDARPVQKLEVSTSRLIFPIR
jgi:hypothetical protein